MPVARSPLALALLIAWAGSACSAPQAGTDAASGDAPSGLPETCPGICNASVPSYPKVSDRSGTGDITMYSTAPSSGGACNYDETNVRFYAAMSVNLQPGDGQGQWQTGRICGQCVEVAALTSTGPKSVVVRIMDKCPDGYCGVDLGGQAPASVMTDGFGRYLGSWRFVSCDGHPEVSDGPPSLHVLAGSNSYWAAVQVRNPPWPISSIKWQQQDASSSGSFSYLGASLENSFLVPVEVLQAKATFALTVQYTDGSLAHAGLTAVELASPDSTYVLQ
jgi:expansin (peptidoglycan-binding protein)